MRINANGNNADIQIHILSDDEMRKLGFTDYREGWWYKSWLLDGKHISFNISMAKDGSDWHIDVLDENFLQPYDYQYMLERNSKNSYAWMIKEKVDEKMLMLRDCGIISGWNVGDYV